MYAQTEAQKKAMEQVRKLLPRLNDYNRGWIAGVSQTMATMAAHNDELNVTPLDHIQQESKEVYTR